MVDVFRTREYYCQLNADDLCQCAYCRNYIKEIRAAYPQVAAYLSSLGIDAEKPFETMPLEPDADGNIMYIGPQYVAFGSKEDFGETYIGNVNIRIAESHPSTDIEEDHFVIEIDPITLKWTVEESE